MDYFLAKRIQTSMDEAIDRLTGLLADQGFSILTDIDMQEALRSKLGAEFRPYRILGSCNAALAQQALELEPQIGALMPCNWMVQEHPDGVEASVMNPSALVAITGNPALEAIQSEVDQKIRSVLAAL